MNIKKNYMFKKNWGDLFAEKETKRGPILRKGLLRRPRSPKGDQCGNTAVPNAMKEGEHYFPHFHTPTQHVVSKVRVVNK